MDMDVDDDDDDEGLEAELAALQGRPVQKKKPQQKKGICPDFFPFSNPFC